MGSPSAFENISLAVQPGALDLTTDNQNVTYISVQSITQPNSTRLDWILYTVPTSAFLLGLSLFSLVLIKHKQRGERIIREKRINRMKLAQYRLNHFSTESVAKDGDVCKVQALEAQSYENVEAAVYSNQTRVTYYIPEANGDDTDYVTPDADICESDGGKGETLHPPPNQTDTDGESYENMESALYAQPRRPTDTVGQEGDYIEPYGEQEEGEKHCNHLTDTDDESYENMDRSAYSQRHNHSESCRSNRATAVQEEDEEEEDSYVKMASIT
ncbi:hypothetical protein COCON_G00201440 [Conger conger]|uniref:Uncharacterized protein n=1 Tax=Conger conger TaxID=82655 RepID=A0A9Q1CZD8_CONCO|nr:uncharacterized protein LOC133114219 [Conger conger]KAJ8253532.1 hypothetical protein COCON_G00201440 [Conger conger]